MCRLGSVTVSINSIVTEYRMTWELGLCTYRYRDTLTVLIGGGEVCPPPREYQSLTQVLDYE